MFSSSFPEAAIPRTSSAPSNPQTASAWDTLAIVGFNGGAALKLAKNTIHFPVDDMRIAEDLQMVVCHTVTLALALPNA